MSTQAFICDAIRTPFGRYGGALASVRTDDLGAVPLKALMARHPKVDWQAVTDVLCGCANQESFSPNPLLAQRGHRRTTTVVVAGSLGGVTKGQAPEQTGRSPRNRPQTAMGR